MTGSKRTPSERKLARQYADLRYDQLCRDLAAFAPGVLHTATRPTDAPVLGNHSLPPLMVPLGDIVAHDHPDRLPAIGIRLPEKTDPSCLAALSALFAEHRTQPFFRPVFLVAGYDLLPLLGRYGFAYHVLSGDDDEQAFAYLAGRYGIGSVRSLIGADEIWTPRSDIHG